MSAYIFFNYAALVKVHGSTYSLHDLEKKTKTRSVRNGQGFSTVIKTNEIKVSPKTYWNISSYCGVFQHYDVNCFLCGWFGSEHDTCNCKEHFTVEEHIENIPLVRRNFMLSDVRNNKPELLEKAERLTPEQIDSVLFTDHKDGYRQLHLDVVNQIIKLYEKVS